MDRNILILTNEDPQFYPLLGPYLANRVVAEVYGDTIWDDPGDVWAIARTDAGEVMGFAAIRPSKRDHSLLLCNDYVKKEYQDDQRLVQTQLLETLLSHYPPPVAITVIAAANEQEYYEAHGFSVAGRKGSFPMMKKTMEEREA